MPEETAQTLRRDLAACREALLAVIAGVSEEQFKRRPPDEPWSIAEVLAHLLQIERLRGSRVATALRENGAEITPSDPEEHEAGARAGRTAPVPQIIHGLLASRREIDLLLDRAASLPDGLDHYVLHPEHGRQTVANMLRERVIAHEREHIAQIESLRAMLQAMPPRNRIRTEDLDSEARGSAPRTP